MTANQIAYWNLQETQRANEAKEAETRRSNKAAEANRADVLAETARHNLAGEIETNRSHLVDESIRRGTLDETIRANREKEENAGLSTGIGFIDTAANIIDKGVKIGAQLYDILK